MQHKKQAYNLIHDICRVNNDVWGNKHRTYDAKQEAAYPIEEALEGFNDLQYLATRLHPEQESHEENFSPKEISRQIVKLASMDAEPSSEDVDAFDKHLDIIYYSIGSLHKLGLSPEQIVEGLQVVHDANCAKSGEKDTQGKVKKDSTFKEPEPILQHILNQRN